MHPLMGTHICVPYHISFNNQDTMGMIRHYRKLIYFNNPRKCPGISVQKFFDKFPILIQMHYSVLYLSETIPFYFGCKS